MDVGKLPALIWSLCWMCTFVDKQGQREEGSYSRRTRTDAPNRCRGGWDRCGTVGELGFVPLYGGLANWAGSGMRPVGLPAAPACSLLAQPSMVTGLARLACELARAGSLRPEPGH